ncbi:glycosyltransferase family 4 protein [Laspinema sp. A4]|uniref:glycosyltransferase family 4 protein n=1 Tax=Laspinema sp. D2d TaxID=2953686 RepID=UPI0021BA6051|nr:glycosyltransferase family 1 protein [Laspinema sp. D2d]MCT7983617.1 glycosyltransferase family 4 protein [Laspinema sp. D2d]
MSADKTWMGGVIYIQNLVKAIASLSLPDVELYLIIPSNSEPELYADIQDLVNKVCVENSLSLNFRNRLWWMILRKFPFLPDQGLSQIVKRENIDFLYPILGTYGFSCNFACKWAAWIPDLQHKYLPNFSSKKIIIAREQVYKFMAKKAPGIIFSSAIALEDFKKFYPDSVAQNFVLNFRTIPEMAWFTSDPVLVQQKYQLPDRFFLVSNQFWRHKNHQIILESLKILKQENINPVIVCTGHLNDMRFPGYQKEILDLIDKYELSEYFKIIGLIPRLDQIQLMRRSLAVIQPSLFEGWSTVVEDARLLGKPMILSDIPVHLEQNPPHSHYFKHNSAQDLADKIKFFLPQLIPGPNLSNEAIAKNLCQKQLEIYGQEFVQIVKKIQNNSQLE